MAKCFSYAIKFKSTNETPMSVQKSREIIWKALLNIPEFKDISFQEFECSVDLSQMEVDQIAQDFLLNPEKSN